MILCFIPYSVTVIARVFDMWIFQVSVKTDLSDILDRMSRCKKGVVNLERKVVYHANAFEFRLYALL